MVDIYITTFFGDTPYNGHAWKIKAQIADSAVARTLSLLYR